MIFGNWLPGGTTLGALLFGYTDSLNLRGESTAVHALLLVVAIALGILAVVRARQRRRTPAIVMGLIAVGFLAWFLLTDSVPEQFTGLTPYVATLLVLLSQRSASACRPRMACATGKGSRSDADRPGCHRLAGAHPSRYGGHGARVCAVLGLPGRCGRARR